MYAVINYADFASNLLSSTRVWVRYRYIAAASGFDISTVMFGPIYRYTNMSMCIVSMNHACLYMACVQCTIVNMNDDWSWSVIYSEYHSEYYS